MFVRTWGGRSQESRMTFSQRSAVRMMTTHNRERRNVNVSLEKQRYLRARLNTRTHTPSSSAWKSRLWNNCWTVARSTRKLTNQSFQSFRVWLVKSMAVIDALTTYKNWSALSKHRGFQTGKITEKKSLK